MGKAKLRVIKQLAPTRAAAVIFMALKYSKELHLNIARSYKQTALNKLTGRVITNQKFKTPGFRGTHGEQSRRYDTMQR